MWTLKSIRKIQWVQNFCKYSYTDVDDMIHSARNDMINSVIQGFLDGPWLQYGTVHWKPSYKSVIDF